MNKKLLISAAAISALCFAFGLTACGNETGNGENGGHVHTAEAFGSDEDVHRKVCTDCGETFAEGDHVYKGSNTCTECGYTIPETAGLEYELDEETDTYAVTGIGTAGDAEKVYIPAYHDGKAVTVIDDAFYGCTFSAIKIPSTVERIEGYALGGCNNLTELRIPDSVTYIKGIGGNAVLKSVTFGKNSKLTEVGKAMFCYCPELTYVNLPDSVRIIEDDTFEESKIYTDKSFWTDGILYVGNHMIAADETVSGKVTVREGTKCIALAAFQDSEDVTEVVLPESLASICDFARGEIKTISIPKNVEYIREGAFNDVYGLDHITVESGNAFYNDGNGSDCLIETATNKLILGSNHATIPAGVTEIGRHGFRFCRSLTKIVIPASCTVLDGWSFMGCSALESIEVADGNPVFQSIGNCLIEKESQTLRVGCNTSVIPTDGSVTVIGSYAFYGRAFETIKIPGAIKTIEERAFGYCEQLKSVIFEDGVSEIESYIFGECTSLTSVEIPASVKKLSGIFKGCDSITQVKYGGTMDDWIALTGRMSLGDSVYTVICTNGTIPPENS